MRRCSWMSMFGLSLIMCLATILLVSAAPAAAQAVFVTATWNDTAVHRLDAGMNDLGSFPAGAGSPNGICSDGSFIYTGHFATQEVIAYDLAGVEQFRWSATIPYLQGMDIVGAELAIANNANIDFFNPADGTYLRSIPSVAGGGVEGIAYDGTVLWLLDDSLVGVDPSNGAVVATIPNAAAGCSYSGTGVTASAPGELMLACDSGAWYRVSSSDGGVLGSGNNGLNMFGLAAIEPVPVELMTFSVE